MRHAKTAVSAGVPPRSCAARSLGTLIKDVAQSLGRSDQSQHNWVKEDQLDRRERDDGLTSTEREELLKLRRENVRLKQEREILKRAATFFAAEAETR